MKAWQFMGRGMPLALREVADPTPGPGEVVVQLTAAGLCGSDAAVLAGDVDEALFGRVPITMGHENAGVVVEIGRDAPGVSIGQRVVVCPSTTAGAPGYAFDGGFAARMAVPAATLVPIPDGIDDALAALAADQGMTAYAAVIRDGGVGAGITVGVIGLNGAGLPGARIARRAGATVYLAEPDEAAWPLAAGIGAAGVRASIADFAEVSFDVVIDFAGLARTTDEAVAAVRRDGRVVLAGSGCADASVRTRALLVNRCELKGSGGTPADVAGVLELMREGDLGVEVTRVPFAEIAAALGRMSRGEVRESLVATFD